jgi:hypothetical protein
MDTVLPDLLRLKAETEPKGCKVTSSFLMREPLWQYLSFYHYYIKKLQVAKAEPRDPHAGGPAAWGRDVDEWCATVAVMSAHMTTRARGC